MQKRHLLTAAGLFLLVACSSDPSGFSIASRGLQPDEIQFSTFAPAALSSRAFDVVNQDEATGNAGVAGKVQPTPAEILSTYAANKFRAVGGPYNTRFVIKQATLQVTNTTPPKKDDSFWSFGFMSGDGSQADMSLNIAVNVVASMPDGSGATISATTMQSEKTGIGSPEDNRKVYMKLMTRALAALDGEINRQLPVYFSTVTAQ